MSVTLLTRREPLLKSNQFVGFVGMGWKTPFQGDDGGRIPGFFRVTHHEPRRRRFDVGIINVASANLPFTINLGNTGVAAVTTSGPFGLFPESDNIIYETRWGIGEHQLLYVLHPVGQYRGGLEAPGFDPQPAAATDRRLIGIWTNQESPIEDPRLAVFTWRDMSLQFQIQQNTPMNYFLSQFWIIVNVLKIERVDNEQLKQDLLNFSLGPGRGVPFRPIFHPSVIPV